MAFNAEQEKIVKKWSGETLQSVKSSYLSLINSRKRSGDGFDTLKVSHKMDHGEVSRVSFKMARHLVFVHGGFGKGIGGKKGSSWLDKSGSRKKTDPKSLGANKGRRKAKEWLNPVLDRELPKLADSLLEEKIDTAVKAIFLK